MPPHESGPAQENVSSHFSSLCPTVRLRTSDERRPLGGPSIATGSCRTEAAALRWSAALGWAAANPPRVGTAPTVGLEGWLSFRRAEEVNKRLSQLSLRGRAIGTGQ